MKSLACATLILLASACATAPAPQPMPRPHAFVPTPTSGPRIQLALAPLDQEPEQPRIGKADLDQARALLSRARSHLEPRHWKSLDGKLTEAERAWERLSRDDRCADVFPPNQFPGYDVLINGKRFDALQAGTLVLWEIKTDNFDTYPAELRKIVLGKQVPELQRERDLARACGYDFVVGVRSSAHQAALQRADNTLKIVVMNGC